MMLVRSELEGREDLDAAALRLYRFGFDRVVLPESTLGYEPRSSCHCTSCASLWIGSKSGPVMRIDLKTESGEPRQMFLSGNREARTISHRHACKALSKPGSATAFLLIGRDDGVLDIIGDDSHFSPGPPQQHRHAADTGLHLNSWARKPTSIVAVNGHVPRVTTDDVHTMGITAIETIDDPAQADAIWILVTTRYPHLFAIHARKGQLKLFGPIAMPGWIDWIVRPEGARDDVLCISRGGDIARVKVSDLRTRPRVKPSIQSLSLHPTAVLPFGKRGLLVGTKRGLALVNDAVSAAVAVPITRSPVLCLDRTVMPDRLVSAGRIHRKNNRQYVTMGLEDGRVRVVDARVIKALAAGKSRRPDHDRHSFSVEMGEAVLAIETLRIDPEAGKRADSAFALAMLRDHSVHLFKVATLETQQEAAAASWHRHVRSASATSELEHPEQDFAAAMAVATRLVNQADELDVCNARKYLVVELVMPELQRLAGADPHRNRAVIDLALAIAKGVEDDRVLRALSLAFGRLAEGNIAHLLELSRAALHGLARYRRSPEATRGALESTTGQPGRITQHRARRWSAVVSSHLGQLHRLAREASSDDDRTRLVAWARFVRKYIVRGHTFATKQLSLGSLVEQNHANSKYFDALIYHARLSQRCYDLRWEHALGDEIAQLHSLPPRPDRSIVVVVTVDAKIMFAGDDGNLLMVHDKREAHERERAAARESRVVVPFDKRTEGSHGWTARRRTLSSAVEPLTTGVRIILAADGEGLPPAGLAIIDVDWGTSPSTGLRLLRINEARCHNAATRVHSLQLLPESSVFLAGLESPDNPVGKLWYSTDDAQRDGEWSLELARERRATSSSDDGARRDNELSSVAPGKVPTRALAVARCPGPRPYLVVTGSDDGQVRAFSCSASDEPDHWPITRWAQVTSAVTSAVLGRHAQRDKPRFSCYLSTAGGETLALSIVDSETPERATFGGYEAHPLWRETHDGAVVAMRMWKTPLYNTAQHGRQHDDEHMVLAVFTQHGRLILYNHACFDKYKLSLAKNYWFRGKRLERISLPGRLTAAGAIDGSTDIVVCGEHGRLYAARLVFLRDTPERDEPEPPSPTGSETVAAPRRGSRDDVVRLPSSMWARFRHLLVRSDVDWLFRPAASSRDDLKLELCELVPIAAVSEHALRLKVEPRCAWYDLGDAALKEQASKLLGALEPDHPEDAVRIKVILKSLSRAFLWRDPDRVIDAIERKEWLKHDETAATCEIVAAYLTHELARSTPATARLRIVAIKELMRVGLLHHMANPNDRRDPPVEDEDARTGVTVLPASERIRVAIERAFASCLRDDERIVRIEALRALSVMLRNVRLMETKKKGVIDSLFPGKLGSIAWALDQVVARLARFPSRASTSALVGGAWYRISVLSQIFRLFPDSTLALCDYITRVRRSDDVVRQCYDLLQRPDANSGGGDTPRTITSRMELYLLSALESSSLDGAADLQQYASSRQRRLDLGLAPKGSPVVYMHPANRAWHEVGDTELAERLLHLIEALARMWRANTIQEAFDASELARARRLASTGAQPPPLEMLEHSVQELAELGRRVHDASDSERRRMLSQTDSLAEGHDALPTAFVTAVNGILGRWRHVHLEARPSSGHLFGKYKLGEARGDDGTRLEFALYDASNPHHRLSEFVITLLWPRSAIGGERFLPGAWLNRRLAENEEYRKYVVEVSDVLRQPGPAYVMRRHDDWLDDLPPQGQSAQERFPVCDRVAEDISKALRGVHAEADGWHGAVKPANIAVIGDGEQRTFRLGRFDRGYRLPGATSDATAPDGVIPEYLVWQAPDAPETCEYRRWEDAVGLLLLLYWMMTGQRVDPRRSALGPHRDRLKQLAEPLTTERPRTRAIIALLRRLFASESDPFTAGEVIDALSLRTVGRRLRAEAPGRWNPPARLAIVHIAGPHSDVRARAESAEMGKHLRDSLYGKDCHIHPCSGTPQKIADALGAVNKPGGVDGDLIVHISCHGRPGELLLRDSMDAGDAHSTREIVDLFKGRRRVRCVVLSACHSEELAQALLEVVEVVVFGAGVVLDDAAAAFTGFYKSLGDGDDLKSACERGNLDVRESRIKSSRSRMLVDLRVAVLPPENMFKAITRDSLDPIQIKFFTPHDVTSRLVPR